MCRTESLIWRNHCKDKALRVLCGWRYPNDIPNKSKFSKVFITTSHLRFQIFPHEHQISNNHDKKITPLDNY